MKIMGKSIRKKDQITELVVLILLLIISFFLWNTYFIYPIKLCVVLLHELSHAVAAFASGGRITEMKIGFDLGGKCDAEGGNAVLIASSGYLGSLFWGLLLFLSPNNKKTGFWIINSVSALILIITFSVSANTSLIILAVMLSAILTASSFYLRIPIITILIRAFGLIGSVYVLFDIKDDLLSNTPQISDATILGGIINVPVVVIGLTWVFISIVAIYLAIRFSYKN
jgi:hypothetical protein